MSSMIDNWCAKEFGSINLGDKRLNLRLITVARNLMNSPTEPINVASEEWAAAKAAYRLFDNTKFHEAELLRVHQKELIKRVGEAEGVVFAIQDTTILNYSHHPKKKGMGRLNKNPGFAAPAKGCFVHNTLIVNEKGCPFGLLDQKVYRRDSLAKIPHKLRPITQKESFRWIEALRTTHALLNNRVITIADRESDIFEFLAEAQELDTPILVRAAKNRILVTEGNHETLWTHMKQVPLACLHKLPLLARHKRPARLATLEVRYASIELKPPQRLSKAQVHDLSPVRIHAVWFYEPNPPSTAEGLEWMLLTNIPVTSEEEAIKLGRWYQLRWQVECYHRVLKSGCKVEECRLETYERIRKYLMLKGIIAFRLLWLTFIARSEPEKPSDHILEKHEWQALCCYARKTGKPPPTAPNTRDALRLIAKLGGFLGRKHDGEPGMTYIWRGWEKLMQMALMWSAIHQEATCG